MKNSALKRQPHRSLKNRAGTIYHRHVSEVERILAIIEYHTDISIAIERDKQEIRKDTNHIGRVWTF